MTETAQIMEQIDIELESAIIKQIQKDGRIVDVTEWQAKKINELYLLKAQLENITEAYKPQLEKAVKSDITKQSQSELDTLNGFLPDPLSPSSAINNQIDDMSKQSFGALTTAIASLEARSVQVYITKVSNIAQLVTVGKLKMKNAIESEVGNIITNGLSLNVGPEKWNPAAYAQMVVRADQNKIAQETMFNAGKQLNADLFRVSSHPESRPDHYRFQNKIYSMSGTSPRYPTIKETGYGTPTGIRGYGCRHILYPFVPGMEEPDKIQSKADNEKAYTQRQEQRKIERMIRNNKKKAILYDKAGISTKVQFYKNKVNEYQSKMIDFIDTTGRKRVPPFEQVYGYSKIK